MILRLIIYIILFTICNIVNGQQIRGFIVFDDNTPAEGIKISAFDCDTRYSQDNGMFILNCPSKKPGQKISLIIQGKNNKDKELIIVNTRQLEWLRMPDTPNHDPIMLN